MKGRTLAGFYLPGWENPVIIEPGDIATQGTTSLKHHNAGKNKHAKSYYLLHEFIR
jgi:hypothetical protein